MKAKVWGERKKEMACITHTISRITKEEDIY